MTEALKAGDIDYARNVTADQFDSLKGLPNIVAVESSVGAPRRTRSRSSSSTPTASRSRAAAPRPRRVQDPAFRDALGYAIDKPALVDKVLGGHGLVGSTIIPPAMAGGFWHLEPPNLRTFDIEVAKQKLDAAGYKLDASGKRLDQEGKPINLKMVVPDVARRPTAQSAEFITGWWKELGIDMTTQSLDADTVIGTGEAARRRPARQGRLRRRHLELGRRRRSRTRCSRSLTTSAIGGNSDTFFSNPRYDELFDAPGQGDRPGQAQGLHRRDAADRLRPGAVSRPVLRRRPAAYRTDRFGGWQLHPDRRAACRSSATDGRLQLPDGAGAGGHRRASAEASASAAPGASEAAVAIAGTERRRPTARAPAAATTPCC